MANNVLTSLGNSYQAAENDVLTARERLTDAKEVSVAAFDEMFRGALTSEHDEIRELAANIDRNETEIEEKRSTLRELRVKAKQNYQALIIAAKVGNAANARDAAKTKDEIDSDVDDLKREIRDLTARVKDDRKALTKAIEALF